ncbi:unnamed protein product [Clonostachys rosea f. rosea IK726]|uniref:Uncharacterized protein n=1 Tax=Clonostachys rosea f. rosea IK726 TaxID=1349383 RepID=A0ACA9U5K9_BIOOC|nr:unnamed protein product [Clonostachys rosea f. rosea IK726]
MEVSITDKGFTRHVLRLEFQGPGMYPLTIIDPPALFYVETETQSVAGKSLVNQPLLEYLSEKESIILNVIAGNQPLASRDALSKVKAIDPSRDRTIGIITKPDLMMAKSESEAEYAKLVTKNDGANKLRLGWHVLRNSADVEDRNAAELDPFKTGVWETVSDSSLGISSLRKKLSKVLYDHIRKSLPDAINNIEMNLHERRTELASLGPPRSNTDERRSVLIEIASQFQSLAKDGVDGRYDDTFFGDLAYENHKFRAQLRNFNRAFQHVPWTKGSSKLIHPDGESCESTEEPPEYLQKFLTTYPYDFPDPIVTTESAFLLDLQRQASINQGKEFPGLPNRDLAIKLFQDQAKPWEAISRFHVEQVTLVAKAFVDAIFEHIVGSPDTNMTTEAILSTCVDPWFSSALGTFAVNVINLAIERCLISGIAKIFTVTQVCQMSKEQLDELAAEPDDIQDRRELLGSYVRVLESPLSLCQKYRPKAVTTLPPTPRTTSLASRPKHSRFAMAKASFARRAKSNVLAPGNAAHSKGSSVLLMPIPDTQESQNESADRTENNK